ncbi:SusC/RagA family TonB-linked outer membrane protein [Flavobacterium gelatinilyticum]|uniref:SusC/RagA family TonB-linked outer membrane protein n=1 Tax=Flavobacterium gelatinilyticum TaxID=3003260 RepID=UPI0024818908|nr:SusC/RagA family TonB-linked outer membrane protein [Flavobacterium gelatinilyticum]
MNIFSFSMGGRACYCLIFIGFLASFSPMSAKNDSTQDNFLPQQHKVQGTVTDGTNPLPGVTIAIKNKKNNSVISDYSGQFFLTTSHYDTLVVSYIGFKTALVPIQGRSVVNIILSYDTTTLQEVKVNAGYYSVKESERTGSIARITSKDIDTQPVSNALAALQGRMAGVNITQTTGVPGGGFTIQVRGRNSIRTDGNNPLYIVDGMPFMSDNRTNSSASAGILAGGMSALNGINPSDIDSIEILKDADATAIYGSRGANGVVLITTRKGKAGKTTFTTNAYTGAGRVTRFIDLMKTPQYLNMRRQAFANDGITNYPEWAYDLNGTWDQDRYTDWQKELLGGTSLIQNIEVGTSGGNESTQFLIKGTIYQEGTVFPGDFGYRKSSVHTSLNHRSENKRFNALLAVNYVSDNNDLPGNNLTVQAYSLAPNAPALYTPSGELNWENSTWENPMAVLEQKYLANTRTLTSSANLGYIIGNGFEVKATLGYAENRLEEMRQSPHTIYDPAYNYTSANSTLLVSNGKQESWSVEPQLNWKKSFGESSFEILLGTTFQERNAQTLSVTGANFASNSLIGNLQAATTSRVTLYDVMRYRYNAVFGRINYNLSGKYILNLTGRRDGSSRFGPGNNFANFGAAGAVWIFSKENFVKDNIHFLSFGKIRSSYGITGSDQIGDYQFMDNYAPTGVNYQGYIGLQPIRLYNSDFSWETNKKLEAAVELGFFSDRLLLTTAWYQNHSSNQLVGIPLPGTTGFTSVQANLGATVQNSGWEFELRTTNFQTANFKWNTTANLTFARNQLLEFPGLETSTYATQYIIGQPLDIRMSYQYTGIDAETGLYTFRDFNGDGQLTIAEDRKKAVNLTPQFFGGLQNSISYKNWQLDFLFQFVKQKGFNYAYLGGVPGGLGNQSVQAGNAWQPENQTANVQMYTSGSNAAALTSFDRFVMSDGAITDASYIRLKNLSLSYALPQAWVKTANCRLYFQAQNLFTFTKYQGPDPENQTQGGLPPLRVLSIGVQLNFQP